MLDQAAQLFAERGFEGTTLKDIAESIGVTRPSLYHYIDSKEDLLGMLVSGLTETAASELAEAEASDLSPAERLATSVRSICLRICAHPARFRLLDRSEHLLPDAFRERHEKAKRAILSHMSRIIENGVERGEFWPVDERAAAFSILGSCNWIAWWFRPDAPGADAGALVDQIAEMAVRSVARCDRRTRSSGIDDTFAAIRADLDLLQRQVSRTDGGDGRG
nr:TetR/AcrR family transcriptional regulator [Pseudonocardia sp. C8]